MIVSCIFSFVFRFVNSTNFALKKGLVTIE